MEPPVRSEMHDHLISSPSSAAYDAYESRTWYGPDEDEEEEEEEEEDDDNCPRSAPLPGR
jgi:hypothetical protein